jgi:hypothetical protein
VEETHWGMTRKEAERSVKKMKEEEEEEVRSKK